MQEQKIILPSPNFEIKQQNNSKPNQPLSNPMIGQAKCLSNHKILPTNKYNQFGGRKPFLKFGNLKEHRSNNNWRNGFNGAWCETCDRGFRSVDELSKHKEEHRICGINGCKFVAHPTIVTKHIQQQHANGLFDRIQKLSSPEEIAKWREERKKRYPTKTNIELRQKAQEERMKRGEKLEDPKGRFGRKRDRRQIRSGENKNHQQLSLDHQQSNGNRRIRKRRKYNHSKTSKIFSPKKEEQVEKVVTKDTEDDDECTYKIPKFRGTRSLNDYERPREKKKVQNVLASMLSIYDSDESESDEASDYEDSMAMNNVVKEIVCVKEIETNQNQETVKKELLDSLQQEGLFNFKSNIKEVHETYDNESKVIEEMPSTSFNENKNDEGGINAHDSDESDMPEEVPIVKVQEVTEISDPKIPNTVLKPEGKKQNTTKVEMKKTLLDFSKLKYRRPNTLLEKLLQPCIRHERNVLLQCVHFVVENDFFGTGSNKT